MSFIEAGIWVVKDDKSDIFVIRSSSSKQSVGIPKDNWEHRVGNTGWSNTFNIKVTEAPNYPRFISIRTKDSNHSKFLDGEYEKTAMIYNEKPVYRKENYFTYYGGKTFEN